MPTALPAGWILLGLDELLREVDVRVASLSAEEKNSIEVLSLTKNRGLIPQSERFSTRVATENIDKYKVIRTAWIVYNPYVIWEGAIHASHRVQPGAVSPVYQVWERTEDDGGFLDFVLRTPALLAAYQSLSAGAVNRRRSIKRDDFLSIKIACPPLEEQKWIAKILNAASNVLDHRLALVQLGMELREAILDRLLTLGINGEALQTTEVGSIPKSWEVAPLGDYFTETKYGLGSKGEEVGRYPLLRMTNQRHGRIVAENLQFVDLEDKDFAKYQLHPRDVMFNRTNSHELVGRTSIFDLDGDYVFASYLVRIRTDHERLLPEFLNLYLGWQQTQVRLKEIARRAIGQSNISASRLKGFLGAIPKTEEQSEIVRLVDEAAHTVDVYRRQIQSLTELRDALAHGLLTGSLKISPAAMEELEDAALVA